MAYCDASDSNLESICMKSISMIPPLPFISLRKEKIAGSTLALLASSLIASSGTKPKLTKLSRQPL